MGKQLTVDVLDCLLGAIDEHDLEENVVVVNFSYGLSIDWIRVARQLVDLLVHLSFNLAHELLVIACFSRFFGDIEVSHCLVLALELPEDNLLVRLRDHHVLLLHLLLQSGLVRRQQLGMGLQEFSEDLSAKFDQDVLDFAQLLQAFGLRKDPEADLHSLNVVLVIRFPSLLLAFLRRLVAFEERTDDQD